MVHPAKESLTNSYPLTRIVQGQFENKEVSEGKEEHNSVYNTREKCDSRSGLHYALIEGWKADCARVWTDRMKDPMEGSATDHSSDKADGGWLEET